MTSITYYSNENKLIIDDCLPFIQFRVYGISDNMSSNGTGRYAMIELTQSAKEQLRNNLYNPSLKSNMMDTYNAFIEDARAVRNRLNKYKRKVDQAIVAIYDLINSDEERKHKSITRDLKYLIGYDNISVANGSVTVFSDKVEEHNIIYNTPDTDVLESLAKALELSDNDDLYQACVETLNAKIKEAMDNTRDQTRTDIEEKATKHVMSKFENRAIECFANFLDVIAWKPIVKESNEFAEMIGTEYYPDEMRYYSNLNIEVISERKYIDMTDVGISTDIIQKLNLIDGTIVHYESLRVKYVKDENATMYTVHGTKMPDAMFTTENRVMKFIGSPNRSTKYLTYTGTGEAMVVGKVDGVEPEGINVFYFVAEGKSVQHLLHINNVIKNQRVEASGYNNSKYAVPDHSLTASAGFINGIAAGPILGSMSTYLEYSNKVSPRARGKIYALFYHQGEAVAADQDNIYVLNPAFYKHSNRPNIFREEDNVSRLQDAHTLQALNYIFSLSKINLTLFNPGNQTDAKTTHTVNTFLTVSILTPDCVGYDDREPFNVKILKSNIFPNIRLQGNLVNRSFSYSKKKDIANTHNSSVCDDPIWPLHFNSNGALEVYSNKICACVAYCNTMEYWFELLTGDSCSVDVVLEKIKKLETNNVLEYDGYTAVVTDVSRFRRYIGNTYRHNMAFVNMLFPKPIQKISNPRFLVKQRTINMMYTIFSLIKNNRLRGLRPVLFSLFPQHKTLDGNVSFERTEISYPRPTKVDMKPYSTTSKETGKQMTFYVTRKINNTKEVSPGVFTLELVPQTSLRNDYITRDVSLVGDDVDRFYRILGSFINDSNLNKFTELNKKAVLPYTDQVNNNVIKETIIVHILSGKATVSQEFKEEMDKFRRDVKPSDKSIPEKITIRTKEGLVNSIANGLITVVDKLVPKETLTYTIPYMVKTEAAGDKPVEKDIIDTQYQHKFANIDIAFITMFMQRIGVSKSLMFKIYNAAADETIKLAALGQLMHEEMDRVTKKLSEEAKRSDVFAPIIELLNTLTTGTEIRNDSTILHTVGVVKLYPFFDNQSNIKFVEEVVTAPAPVEEVAKKPAKPKLDRTLRVTVRNVPTQSADTQ